MLKAHSFLFIFPVLRHRRLLPTEYDQLCFYFVYYDRVFFFNLINQIAGHVSDHGRRATIAVIG